jgi:phospholipase/lecithinase/hemolysin
VTLLIGVNNQYQNRPFSLYETEFPELLQTAITLAKGDKNRVIVVSIPDYAFTPFGQSSSNPQNISNQLDNYNSFAKNHAESLGISFLNITDLTREGLNNPSLVASDNLHPSQLAYSKFVERMLPIALNKIQ